MNFVEETALYNLRTSMIKLQFKFKVIWQVEDHGIKLMAGYANTQLRKYHDIYSNSKKWTLLKKLRSTISALQLSNCDLISKRFGALKISVGQSHVFIDVDWNNRSDCVNNRSLMNNRADNSSNSTLTWQQRINIHRPRSCWLVGWGPTRDLVRKIIAILKNFEKKEKLVINYFGKLFRILKNLNRICQKSFRFPKESAKNLPRICQESFKSWKILKKTAKNPWESWKIHEKSSNLPRILRNPEKSAKNPSESLKILKNL